MRKREHSGTARRGMGQWLARPQRRLGTGGFVLLMVLGSLVAPLSLDMYTPAVPHMAAWFHTTPDAVNLTLVGYYLFLAVGLLVFGPLSDKYGRRPVLVAGLAAYCAASMCCALSANIWMLVAARVVQALGSGAMSAVCMAMVKDAVKPAYRERMLAVLQVMFVVGPVAAPIIGAGILQVADWRATFWTLAAISAAELVMGLLFEETLPPSQRTRGSIPHAIGRIGAVSRNIPFSAFLLITGVFEVPFMAYIAVGSYIYMDHFGFSEVGYSLFFAVAALMTAAGPMFWMRISGATTVKRFTTIALALSAGAGAAMLAFGHGGAFAFCGLFIVFAFLEATVRPYSINVLLAQHEGDAGAASGLINFARTALGVAGMFAIMLPWPDYLSGVGWLIVLSMLGALAGWAALLRSTAILRGVKDDPAPTGLL